MLKDALAWNKISLNVKDDENNGTTSFHVIVDTSAVGDKDWQQGTLLGQVILINIPIKACEEKAVNLGDGSLSSLVFRRHTRQQQQADTTWYLLYCLEKFWQLDKPQNSRSNLSEHHTITKLKISLLGILPFLWGSRVTALSSWIDHSHRVWCGSSDGLSAISDRWSGTQILELVCHHCRMTDISTGHMLHSDGRLWSKQAKNCNFKMRHMLDGSRIQRSRCLCRTCAFMWKAAQDFVAMPAMFVTDSVNNCCERLLSYIDCVCEFVYRHQQHFVNVICSKSLLF